MPKPDQLSPAERESGQRKRRGRRGSPSPFEAVWEGDSEMAASVVAGSLETDGIRAMMQGLTPAAGTPAHAFSRGTWAVFVPGNQAAEARALLRGRGDNGVVEGAGDMSGSQRATLKFAVAGLMLVVIWGLVMVILNR